MSIFLLKYNNENIVFEYNFLIIELYRLIRIIIFPDAVGEAGQFLQTVGVQAPVPGDKEVSQRETGAREREIDR